MTTHQVRVGDSVQINVSWADNEFPNCNGTVIDLRHGGAVAVISTNVGRSPCVLHVNYLR